MGVEGQGKGELYRIMVYDYLTSWSKLDFMRGLPAASWCCFPSLHNKKEIITRILHFFLHL